MPLSFVCQWIVWDSYSSTYFLVLIVYFSSLGLESFPIFSWEFLLETSYGFHFINHHHMRPPNNFHVSQIVVGRNSDIWSFLNKFSAFNKDSLVNVEKPIQWYKDCIFDLETLWWPDETIYMTTSVITFSFYFYFSISYKRIGICLFADATLPTWNSSSSPSLFLCFPSRFLIVGLHVISSYAISTAAISTAAISTVYTFNRSHFQPLAFSAACKFNRLQIQPPQIRPI